MTLNGSHTVGYMSLWKIKTFSEYPDGLGMLANWVVRDSQAVDGLKFFNDWASDIWIDQPIRGTIVFKFNCEVIRINRLKVLDVDDKWHMTKFRLAYTTLALIVLKEVFSRLNIVLVDIDHYNCRFYEGCPMSIGTRICHWHRCLDCTHYDAKTQTHTHTYIHIIYTILYMHISNTDCIHMQCMHAYM